MIFRSAWKFAIKPFQATSTSHQISKVTRYQNVPSTHLVVKTRPFPHGVPFPLQNRQSSPYFLHDHLLHESEICSCLLDQVRLVQDILLKLAWYEVGPHLAGHLAVHVMSGRDVTIWFHAKEVFHYLSIFTKSFVQFLLGPDIERALFPDQRNSS